MAGGYDREADVILVGGTILTGSGPFGEATGLAVRGDRIVVVGPAEKIKEMAGPTTRIVDLQGGTAIPGLIDTHNHMLRAGLDLQKVQLGDCRTLDDVLGRLTARARETPDGEWVVASASWHEAGLAEKRLPTREELDGAAPRHPVYIPRGGHTAVANTAAFLRAGIGEDAPDPEGGAFVRDGKTGKLTGQLFETPAMSIAERCIPTPTLQDRVKALWKIQGLYHAAGIVGIRDPGLVAFPGLSGEDLAAYMAFWRRGDLTMRVNLMVGFPPTGNAAQAIARLEAQAFKSGFGDARLRIGGLKLMLDGGVETALLRAPYASDPSSRGVQVHSREFLATLLRDARRLGWPVGCHAVGDAAVDLLCDVYAEVHRQGPLTEAGWAVEHAILADADQARRLRDMGVAVTAQILHNVKLGQNMVRHWGPARAHAAYPLRTWLDLGLAVAGGTDANICPYDQLRSIQAAVTRETEQAGRLGPDQAISVEEALRIHTAAAAALTGDGGDRGSLEEGKLADLAVVSADPRQVSPDQIGGLQVRLTMVGGRIVHPRGKKPAADSTERGKA